MHSEYQNRLPFYVKGLLSAEERTWLEKHLDQCESCREDVRQWREVAEAVKAEAATWIPFLSPPPLKLPNERLHPHWSDDGKRGRYHGFQAAEEGPMLAKTVIPNRLQESFRQRVSNRVAAMGLVVLLSSAIMVLAAVLLGVKGNGQPGGPPIHIRAITPTIIPSPTPTLIPTPVPPLPIEPDNVDQLTQVAMMGQGYSTDIAWSPDGKTLAVGTSIDVLLYDSALLTSEPRPVGVSVGEVNSLAFSPDGTTLAIGGRRATVLWDMNAEQERVIQQNDGGVLELIFSPDGTKLAARREDGLACIWDIATGHMVATLGAGSGDILSIVFSPDGATLAAGTDDERVQLWDVTSGRMRMPLEGHTSEVLSVAFSPDGMILASGGDDNTIRLWSAETGEALAVLEGHSQDVTTLGFSPDGQLLASGSYDNSARLWDVATGELRATLKGHTGDVRTLAFSPDGMILASASSWEDSTLRLWDVASGEPLAVLEGCVRSAHRGEVGRVAFSPDGSDLALNCGDAGIAIWDVATGQPLFGFWQGGGGSVNSLAINPDGTILAIGRGGGWTEPGTVQLWSATTGQERAVLQGHTAWVRSVAFSPDGTQLASGSGDRTVKLWNTATGELVLTLEPLNEGSVAGESTISDDDGDVVQYLGIYSDAVWSVAFSPDGTKLAVGRGDPWVGPGSMQLYEVTTGALLREFNAENPPLCCEMISVYNLVFSPDGTMLATADGDGVARLWDVATGEERAVLNSDTGWVGSVAFSPDGSLLATGGAWSDCDYGEVCPPDEGELRLWDVATSEQLALVEGPLGGVSGVAFSPDGKLIAFVGGWEDGSVSLWDVETRETLAVFDSPYVSSVIFSADGAMLVTGGSDGTVRLWRATAR